MRFSWLAMLLLAGVWRAKPARAEEARFAWEGPDCPTSAPLFQTRLEKLIGEADLRRLAGRVGIARQGDTWRVALAIALDGKALGERRFETKSCEHAAETAAVAASMAVFDGGSEPEPEVAAASGISPDIWTHGAEPVPDFTRPPAPPTVAPAPGIEPRVGILGLAEVGVVPQPVLGAAIEAELGFTQRYSAALIGSVTAAQERDLGGEQSVSLRVFAATARACAAPARGPRYRVDGCAGARLMVVQGRGDGFDVNRSGSLRWWAPLLGANVSLRAPRYLEWRLEIDASVPLSRRSFLVDGEQVSRPNVVVLAVRLGPVLRFR